ncbi:MAG TPA: tetratricopeptide repeat protein, partial [Thermoanaerobaculia bacterium]|nr:tetratricopeptide repeat protein [Thermoanaerobaculia bacterium]
VERLRATDADEVLLSRLDCSDDSCRVSFRRQKPGGEVLAAIASFEVQTAVENAHQLAEAVRVNLEQAYPDHPVRPGSPGGKVRREDYSAYIEIQRKVDTGKLVGGEELERLDDLLQTSPGLVGAYELAAGIARNQRDLDRAFYYAVKAEKIAPYDPRPLFTRFRIEIKQNQLDAAGATLDRFADLAPADIRVARAEAELLVAEGELEKARHLRQKVVQRRPTWRHILELATLELSLGAREDARRRLTDLLKARPNNHYVLESLAMLEVTSGDLGRAAALYERLIRIQPTLPYLTNLGFVRYLLGDYSAAAAAYRQALDLSPGHMQARFNLATALEAQGDLNEAHSLFLALEKELAATSSLDVQTRMLHAQCLARLGRRSDAARLADEVLKQRPEDVHVLHQAAQLYAFLGDRYSALFYTKLALEKGLRREWFTIPGFRPLKGDQEFQTLLDTAPVARATG